MQNKKIAALALFLVAICILALWALQPQSTKQHYPLYDEITAIKDRLSITITEPSFTNPVRECDFYELREEDSGDYFQTTVDYWVFQHGQEEHETSKPMSKYTMNQTVQTSSPSKSRDSAGTN
jgi:hypothetical protein